MQQGSLVRSKRKHPPDVWQFRWSERGPNRKRVYRRRVIGTVEQYQDEGAARGAVAVLVSEINSHQPIASVNPLTVAQLADHFEQRELGRQHLANSCDQEDVQGTHEAVDSALLGAASPV